MAVGDIAPVPDTRFEDTLESRVRICCGRRGPAGQPTCAALAPPIEATAVKERIDREVGRIALGRGSAAGSVRLLAGLLRRRRDDVRSSRK
jgi:hypothetical protein